MKKFLHRELCATIHRTRVPFAIVALLLSTGTSEAQTKSTYTGDDFGNYSDAANWSPMIVPNNAGAQTFDVTVPSDVDIVLDLDVTVNSFSAAGDNPVEDANLISVDQNFTSGKTSLGNGGVDFTADTKDVAFRLGNLADFSGTTLNSGYFLFANASAGHSARLIFKGANIVNNNAGPAFGGPGITRFEDENGNDAFRNFNHNLLGGFIQVVLDGGHFDVANSMTNEGNFVAFEGGTLTFARDVTQVGDFRDPNDTGQGGFLTAISSAIDTPARIIINGALTNYDAASKTLHSGRYLLQGSADGVATIQVFGGPALDIVNNDASILLTGQSSAILDKDGANALRNLALSHRLRFIARDFTTVGSLTVIASEFATLATRGRSHLTISGDLNVNGGSLELSVLGFQKTGKPTSSSVTVNGGFTLAPATLTHFEVFGPTVTTSASVLGSAKLDGTLEVFTVPNAPITSGGSLTLLTAKTITGSFANVVSGRRVTSYAISGLNDALGTFDGVINGSFTATYDNNSLVISDFQPHASMLNIATRLQVQPGDKAGIAGFIVNGRAPKNVVIRGIGPSLIGSGVAGALQDPTLELHDASGALVTANDNWQSDSDGSAAVTASGLAPKDPRESAIATTLDPGSYTAILRGANNSSGIGLVEVYDIEAQPSGAEFANLSTRGSVGTGDNVMIGGVIIGPDAPGNVVVRALGPSLAGKGVATPLQDPTLEVRDSSGTLIAQNDNWLIDNNTHALQFEQEGLAPDDFRESALQLTLKPGNYTAIVRGQKNTTGIALVEFFKLN